MKTTYQRTTGREWEVTTKHTRQGLEYSIEGTITIPADADEEDTLNKYRKLQEGWLRKYLKDHP